VVGIKYNFSTTFMLETSEVGGVMRLTKPIAVVLSLMMVLVVASGPVAATRGEDNAVTRPPGGGGPLGVCEHFTVELNTGWNNGHPYTSAVVSWTPGHFVGWTPDDIHTAASTCMGAVQNRVNDPYTQIEQKWRLTGELLAHIGAYPAEELAEWAVGEFHNSNPANIGITEHAPTRVS
jgi:hypothetical protein